MLPDAEALIRRSGAAAPLLNAVRERSARESVRSVIERLTGAPAARGSRATRPGNAGPSAIGGFVRTAPAGSCASADIRLSSRNGRIT